MYPHQWAGRQQQSPIRDRRQVTYYMEPLPGVRDGHRFGVNRILRLGDDSLLSAGRDGVIRRWDVAPLLFPGDCEGDSGNQPPPCTGVFASHTHWVTGLAVAVGRILASSSNDGTIKLWDLSAAGRGAGIGGYKEGLEDHNGNLGGLGESLGERVRSGRDEEWGRSSAGAANEAVLHPNGSSNRGGIGAKGGTGLDGTGSGSNARDDGSAAAARRAGLAAQNLAPSLPPRPYPLATVAGHGDYVKCLTYAPEAGVLVSGGLDKRILLWDLKRMAAPLMVLRTGDGEVESASPPTRGLAGGRPWCGEDAWFYVRDPARVVLRPGAVPAGPNEVFELCRQNKGSVYCVDASPNAALVASGGTDRMIRLLDPRAGSGHAARVCKLDGHQDNVRCVRIDGSGTRVVSGSTDGTLRVWDVRQQCCLGVYNLPGGSVWAMQPSPCDYDIYYSGGRGKRVYRTDFRTGESVLVCMTKSEVLDMALERDRVSLGHEESMSMWLSSTEPNITFWGGRQGGAGAALQRGCPSSNNGIYASSHLKKEDGGLVEAGKGLLDRPVAVIQGQPGIVRHVVLNNRRHVLTEDDAKPPNVALWDVTKARQVEAYPRGTVMQEKERSLREIIAVRPWFTVDTHLGTPLVNLSENTVFDGELYAVDAKGERQTFVKGAKESAGAGEEAMEAGEGSADKGSGMVGGDGRDGHLSRVTQAPRSVQDEVKVNLGDAVLRGLFSRWMEQHLRFHSDRIGSRRQRGGSGSVDGRHADNGSAYSSGESDSDDDSEQGEGWEDESSLTSPVSGESSQASARDGGARLLGSGSVQGSNSLNMDLADGDGHDGWEGATRGGSSRAIREDTVVLVTEGELGGNGGMQRTLLQKRVGEFDGTEGHGIIPPWVTACVIHGEFRAREQTKVAFFLGPWVPPHQIAPLSTSQQQQQQQKQNMASRGSVKSAAVGQQMSQRFTAPAQMLVSKVMVYVLSHSNLRQHLHSPGTNGQGGDADLEEDEGSGLRQSPQDLVEVLCGDRVLEPHLYIGAIQEHIWSPRNSGTLFLHYRSPSPSPEG